MGSAQRMGLNFDSDLSLTTAGKKRVSNCKKSLGEGSGKHCTTVASVIASLNLKMVNSSCLPSN